MILKFFENFYKLGLHSYSLEGDVVKHLVARINEASIQLRLRRRIDPETGCWMWTGAKDRHGAAILSLHGSQDPAARMSWDFHYPDSPSTWCIVKHICKRRACINPEHLYTIRVSWFLPYAACQGGHTLHEDNTYIWLAANGREIQACKQCRHLRRTL